MEEMSSTETRVIEQCRSLGIPWMTDPPEFDPEAAELIPAEDAIRMRLIPISQSNGSLEVVMRNPLDLSAVDEAAVLASYPIKRIGIDEGPYRKVLEAQYGTTAARMAESLAGDTDEESLFDQNIEAIDTEDLHRMAEQPTLINLVNLKIGRAHV